MLSKELQDLAWSVLPKEFKEEVKKIWIVEGYCAIKYKSELHKHRIDLLYELFGDNLTSDAKGEEMCIISRTNVEALHSEIHKAIMDAHDANNWQDAAHYILDVLPRSFDRLFGSKCLPEEKKGIDLDELNAKLDKALESETKESLEEWINKHNIEDKYFCSRDCRFNGVGYLQGNQCDKVLCNRRVPKRWHPKNREPYWFINFNTLKPEQSLRSNPDFDWENDFNHFQTESLAQQASEAVRKCLEEFHENNQ